MCTRSRIASTRLLSRREWLRSTTAISALASFPVASNRASFGLPIVHHGYSNDIYPLVDPTQVRTLALRAIDAARMAGATYADVRLTRTVSSESFSDDERLAIGVRALCNGAWGFASAPYWDADAVVALAREAVSQAKVNIVGNMQPIELGEAAAVTGSWTMPGIDPFSIPIEERKELVQGWIRGVADRPKTHFYVAESRYDLNLVRQEKCFASTQGSLVTQTIYRCSGEFTIRFQSTNWRQEDQISVQAAGLDTAGKGWDLFLNARVRDQIPRLLESGLELRRVRIKPVEVGRYSLVLDGVSAARLVDSTFGVATQLDRALGYEANAAGTSYLGPDPLALLGTHMVASPLVTVTANRTMPGGAATVNWDDEGVEPTEATLVTRGILTDYQTTREQSVWLAPYYQKSNTPVRSRGYAASSSAYDEPIQHVPNLVLRAVPNGPTFETLVQQIENGIAIQGGMVNTDFQATTGVGSGAIVREVRNGRLGSRLSGMGFSFNSTELWKSVQAVGGPLSVHRSTAPAMKGEPEQVTYHSVDAPAIGISNATIIDLRRTA